MPRKAEIMVTLFYHERLEVSATINKGVGMYMVISRHLPGQAVDGQGWF